MQWLSLRLTEESVPMNVYCRNFVQFHLLVLIAVALGLLYGPPIILAASPSKLVIGYASTTPRLMPLWIARDQGFFAKYGIASEPRPLAQWRDPCHRNGFGRPNR